jgi:hypothetical protein
MCPYILKLKARIDGYKSLKFKHKTRKTKNLKQYFYLGPLTLPNFQNLFKNNKIVYWQASDP